MLAGLFLVLPYFRCRPPRASPPFSLYEATAGRHAIPPRPSLLSLRHSPYSTLFRHVPLSPSIALDSPSVRRSPRCCVRVRPSVPFAISRALASGLGPVAASCLCPRGAQKANLLCKAVNRNFKFCLLPKVERAYLPFFLEALCCAKIPGAINFVRGKKEGRKAVRRWAHVSLLSLKLYFRRERERKPTEILIPTAAELVKGAGKAPHVGWARPHHVFQGGPHASPLFLQNLSFPISGLESCKTF